MKRSLWMALAITLAIIGASPAAYANIDNLSNMSAEWIRTGNRNAATDAADIVLYNPAGLTELTQGFHLNFGNQSLIRKPEHSFNAGEEYSYEQDSADPILPNIYMAYTHSNWSVFGGVYVPGGGAVVDYPDGSFTTKIAGAEALMSDTPEAFGELANFFPVLGTIYTELNNESLEASSMYITSTLGSAYKVNDTFSFAVGMRYINAKNTIEAKLDLTGLSENAQGYNNTPGLPEDQKIPESLSLEVDIEDTAEGMGGIFSFNVMPTSKLNLAFQYQTRVKLDFETDVKTDDMDMFEDGAKNRRDFPAFAGFGAGYQVSDKLYTEFNYSYWFQKDADWGEDAEGKDISDMAGDAWSAGATASYQLLSKLLVSAGTTFTKFEWEDMNGYYAANLGSVEVLYTDNWHVGAGIAYEVADNMKLNLSVARTIWEDETLKFGELEVDTQNETTVLAVGFDAAF